MAYVSGPGFGFLSPREVEGIFNDLHVGESFLDGFLKPTPLSTRQGIIKKATSNRFGLKNQSAKYRPGDTVKAGPGAKVEDVSVVCQPYAWREGTPWEDATSVASYLPMFRFNAQVAHDVVLTERDLDAATAIAAGSWAYSSNTPNAADRWSASTSKPLAQLVTMRNALRFARPNALLMAQDVFSAFMTNDSVLDGLNVNADHGLADKAYLDAVARRLAIQHVVVVDSAYNTTESNASQVLADTFAGKVWMGRVNTAPGLSNPAGAIDGLQSTALARVQMSPLGIREYDEDAERTRFAEAFCCETTVVADTRLGGILTAVLG